MVETKMIRRIFYVVLFSGFVVSLIVALLRDDNQPAILSSVGFGAGGAGLWAIDRLKFFGEEGGLLKMWYALLWVSFLVSLLCAIGLEKQASTTSAFVAIGSGVFLAVTAGVNYFVTDSAQDRFVTRYWNGGITGNVSKEEIDDVARQARKASNILQNKIATNRLKPTSTLKEKDVSFIENVYVRDLCVGLNPLAAANYMENLRHYMTNGFKYCNNDKKYTNLSLEEFFSIYDKSNNRCLQRKDCNRIYKHEHDLLNISCGTTDIPVCRKGKKKFYKNKTTPITCN